MTIKRMVAVYGSDPELIEKAVNGLDRIVRHYYNIYGGRRIESGRLEGEHYVKMLYSFDHNFPGLWPGWDELKRGWFHFMARIDRDDDLGLYIETVEG